MSSGAVTLGEVAGKLRIAGGCLLPVRVAETWGLMDLGNVMLAQFRRPAAATHHQIFSRRLEPRTKSVGIELLPRPYGVVDQHLALRHALGQLGQVHLPIHHRSPLPITKPGHRQEVINAPKVVQWSGRPPLLAAPTRLNPSLSRCQRGPRAGCVMQLSSI